MPINDSDFRAAKSILADAGCVAADRPDAKTHGATSHSDSSGSDLVQTCTQEFQQQDHGRSDLFGSFGMTKRHYESITQAKKRLGLR